MHGRPLYSSSVSIKKLAQHPLDPVTQHVRSGISNAMERSPKSPAGGTTTTIGRGSTLFLVPFIRAAPYHVGVGAGQFVNALALSGLYERVIGVDTAVFEKYFELDSSIERRNISIESLPFPDDYFDVVRVWKY